MFMLLKTTVFIGGYILWYACINLNFIDLIEEKRSDTIVSNLSILDGCGGWI